MGVLTAIAVGLVFALSAQAADVNLPLAIKHACSAQLGEPRINVLGGNAFNTGPGMAYYPHVNIASCGQRTKDEINQTIRAGQEACLAAYGIDLRGTSRDGLPRFAPDSMNDSMVLSWLKNAITQYNSRFQEISESEGGAGDAGKKCAEEVSHFENLFAQTMKEELEKTVEMVMDRQTAEIDVNAPKVARVPATAPPQAVPAVHSKGVADKVAESVAEKPVPQQSIAVEAAPVAPARPAVASSVVQPTVPGEVTWTGDLKKRESPHYFIFSSQKGQKKNGRGIVYYVGKVDHLTQGKPLDPGSIQAFQTSEEVAPEKLESFVQKKIQDEATANEVSLARGELPPSRRGNLQLSTVLTRSAISHLNMSPASPAVKVAEKAVENVKEKVKEKVKENSPEKVAESDGSKKKYFVYQDASTGKSYLGAMDLNDAHTDIVFVRIYPISSDEAQSYHGLKSEALHTAWIHLKEKLGRSPASLPVEHPFSQLKGLEAFLTPYLKPRKK